MSYCVNCGVALADSEKSCPLCGVITNNPLKPWSEPQSRPYPNRVDAIVEPINRNFGVGLVSLFLLIPSVVTFLSDFFTSGGITWSGYVVGACFLAYIFFLFPLLFKKAKPFLFIALDAVALLAYLALIASHDKFVWFLPLAAPIVLISAAFSLVAVTTLRLKKYPGLNKAAVIFLAVSVLCVSLDIVISAYNGNGLVPSWSLYSAAPCIITAIMMLYTERHKAFKEKIRRRLFY